MRALPLLLVLVLAPFSDVLAQQQPLLLEPGQRVRVTAPDLGIRKLAGRLETLRGDTLVVAADSTMTFPVASVTRLEVHRGRKSRAVWGAAVGFAIGAGGLVALLSSESVCNPENPCDAGNYAKGIAILGGLGAGLGVLVGQFIKADQWDDVPLSHLRVSVVPQRDGFGIGARIAF